MNNYSNIFTNKELTYSFTFILFFFVGWFSVVAIRDCSYDYFNEDDLNSDIERECMFDTGSDCMLDNDTDSYCVQDSE